MIEQNPVRREHLVSFPVIHRHPVRVNFRCGVWAARLKRCCFTLRGRGAAEHFTARGVIKFRFDARFTNRFQEPYGTEARDLASVFRNVKTDANVALRSEVVNLGRIDCPDDLVQ